MFFILLFGPTNASAAFMHLMNKVFARDLGEFANVHLNDIQVHSKTSEDYPRHLEAVMKGPGKTFMESYPNKVLLSKK